MGSWAYFDPEVSIDNSSCKDCTLVKVDSMNKPGILLEVVQVLTDLDLTITKAYISSDGGWFMDVFHVTDQQGQKISDNRTIEHIEKALGPKGNTSGILKTWPGKRVGVNSMNEDYTAIELIGRDRPGLLSEIFAVLASLHFNVAAAEVWTHNRRIACVLYVNDDTTNRAVDDPSRLSAMEEQLKNILRGCGAGADNVARTSFSVGSTHVDRRLHQLLFADRDYEGGCAGGGDGADCATIKPKVTIDRCEEKDYSVVTVRCKDRSKLMFDIVCTLTDMQYVVFHATISSEGPYATQEYYIRHMDGATLETEAEKEMVIKLTRVLRENGLSVTRAGVTTVGEQALNVFYVSDASGKPVDAKTIEMLRKEIGQTMRLNVKKAPASAKALEASGSGKPSFFFGSLLEKFRA
ncbi:act domain-containing protein acr3 [Phtheirospermum japonicum]|uniref:ACT domain-containing protein ACR n=1 Tax=Phtheirospermum japonicum TaxID=374723 RepID=A0A830CRN4_9LAMI|nr:act domain-containing protein acr3 [Phtheirospermum japonicum]